MIIYYCYLLSREREDNIWKEYFLVIIVVSLGKSCIIHSIITLLDNKRLDVLKNDLKPDLNNSRFGRSICNKSFHWYTRHDKCSSIIK